MSAIPPTTEPPAPEWATPTPPAFEDPGGDPCEIGSDKPWRCAGSLTGWMAMPAPLYWATRQYLDEWQLYPVSVALAMQQLEDGWLDVVAKRDAAGELRLAQEKLRVAEEVGGWAWWEYLGVTGIAVGCVLGGFVLGFVAGAVGG